MKLKVRGVWAENESGQKETKVISTAQTEGPVRNWIPVHAEQEYVIVIEIARESSGFKVRTDLGFFSFFHPIPNSPPPSLSSAPSANSQIIIKSSTFLIKI